MMCVLFSTTNHQSLPPSHLQPINRVVAVHLASTVYTLYTMYIMLPTFRTTLSQLINSTMRSFYNHTRLSIRRRLWSHHSQSEPHTHKHYQVLDSLTVNGNCLAVAKLLSQVTWPGARPPGI